ncbi:MAG: hypothetical protein J0I26_03285, partial [Alphaproteobacteria bacterium]|nr:hypothetical protein [Alphaproteobacteria bacterium]
MADSAIFRNAVMPEEADASVAQASLRRLEAGLLPDRRVGSHRRIRFTDIAAFRAGPGARHRTETPMPFDPVEDA